MKLHITTISENTAATPNLLAEWGLSILIETGETNVLFDSGLSISAAHNADKLGVDLSKIDKIVLSHGHYDHTGGLVAILGKMKDGIEITAHPDIWQSKYSRRQGQADRNIGIPFSRQELEEHGARFSLEAKPVKINDDIITSGEIPMVTEFESIDSDLYIKEAGGWQPDKLLDDQAIIINTEAGLVVIAGCAHRGIINTLYHAQQVTGVKTIHAVLGGTHLMRASEERMWLTIAALKELGVRRLGLSHCTGLAASCLLLQEFGESFMFNNAGTKIELP